MQLSSLLLHLADVLSRLLQRGGFTDLFQQTGGGGGDYNMSVTFHSWAHVGRSATFTLHSCAATSAAPLPHVYTLYLDAGLRAECRHEIM